jgi:hypothetical protein
MGRPRTDHVGQRFGRLVAVSFVGKKHHNAVWLFRCDCGSEHGASISNVARQDRPIRSCGCLYCEVAGKHVRTPGHAGLRNADLQIIGGDEAVLHQIAALNEALTLAVSLLRVAVGAVRSKRTGAALSFTCCARLEGVPNAWRTRWRA